MRSTMRTITNVSIDNRAVDLTTEGLSFTNNADHISFITFDYYDLESHAHFTRTLGDGASTDYSRGQTITVGMSSDTSFHAGHDYICTARIYQRQAGDMSEETSTGYYDVYMGAGKLQDDSEVATEVYIDKDITFIVAPVYRYGTTLTGGCVLRLSDRDLLITAYNPATGKATVAGAKINGTTSTTRTTVKGESYKLITNYLACDPFVFYYRTTPTISVSCSLTTAGIVAAGTYSQAQGTEIQSWRMWADYNNNPDGYHDQSNSKMIIRHEKKFTDTIADIFPLSATNGYDEVPEDPAAVDIYLEVTTQDGVTVQTRERLGYSAGYPLTVTLGITPDTPTITGMPNGRYWIYRRRDTSTSGSPVFLDYKYIGSAAADSTLRTAENGYRTYYQYIVCGVDTDGKIYYGKSSEFIHPARQWSLEHIVKTGYNAYHADGDRYFFTVDVNPSQIETVVGGNVYGTEGRFPKYIHGSDRYDTGSFTALLGSVNAQEASVFNIEKWIKFISQEGLFLLKTDSGDVKIVAITGNPSRQYGSSLAELGLVRVTYTYAEVADVDEVTVT